MAIKLDKFSGTDNVDGAVLSAADQNDTFNETKQEFINIYSSIEDAGFIIGHSANVASYADVDTAIFNTTDYQSGNITWTNKNSNMQDDQGILGVNCKADRTNAVALERDTGDGAFTINSGGAWIDTTTDPPNVTAISDLSCPTTSLAVAFGDNSGAGENVWVSTDKGANWAEVSDAAVVFDCGDMFDGTTGFAVESAAANIYISTDSADTWSDTTRDLPIVVNQNATLFAVSATVYLIAVSGNGVFKGTTAANPTRVAVAPSANYRPSKFIKVADGNIYILWISPGADATFVKPLILMKSTDDGDTWTQSTIYAGYADDSGTVLNAKFILSEAADNVLIMASSSGITVDRAGIVEVIAF